MLSGMYEYFAQERIHFGKPVGDVVEHELGRLDAQRVFIVATRTLSRKTEVVTNLISVLGNRFAGLFDDCESHVPRQTVFAASEKAREANPDLLISIGGGSAIDTGKMVLICLAENVHTGAELDLLYVKTADDGSVTVPPIKTPPCRPIAIPTTLSGGEFSHTAGSTDTERRVKDIYIQTRYRRRGCGSRSRDHGVHSRMGVAGKRYSGRGSRNWFTLLATGATIHRCHMLFGSGDPQRVASPKQATARRCRSTPR